MKNYMYSKQIAKCPLSDYIDFDEKCAVFKMRLELVQIQQ